MANNMADNTIGYELDWDATIENDSQFTVLPEGTYPFTITKMERGRHTGSQKLPPCNKAILTVRVDGGAKGAAVLTENLFLFSTCEGILCSFFSSIGMRRHGEKMALNWSHVPGASGWAQIGVRSWTDRNGNARQSNQVIRWIAAEDAPAAQSQAAAQGWTPGQF